MWMFPYRNDPTMVSVSGSSKRLTPCIESLSDMMMVKRRVPLKCMWWDKGVCQTMVSKSGSSKRLISCIESLSDMMVRGFKTGWTRRSDPFDPPVLTGQAKVFGSVL